MQKTHDSQCQGPGKTSLLLGVGVFASALDQSGAKRGVAHIRLRAVGSWEVVPGWSRSRHADRLRMLRTEWGMGRWLWNKSVLGWVACLCVAGPMVRGLASWPKGTTGNKVGAYALLHKGI